MARSSSPSANPAPDPKTAAEICPVCRGSGWRVEPDGGAGKAIRCECRKQNRARELSSLAGIPERYRACSLDNFTTSVSADKMVNGLLLAAKRSCSEYIDGFLAHRKTGQGLLFYGPPGVGKTHLAVAVLNELIDRHQVAGRYADFTSLMFAIHGTFDDSSTESLATVLRPVIEAEVLVLDELGAQKPTEWVLQNLYWIINRRYNEQRPTIFTTNYHPEPADSPQGEVSPEKPPNRLSPQPYHADAVESANERSFEKLSHRLSPQLVSRLYEMAKPVKMPGFDYRREHRSAQRPRPKL